MRSRPYIGPSRSRAKKYSSLSLVFALRAYKKHNDFKDKFHPGRRREEEPLPGIQLGGEENKLGRSNNKEICFSSVGRGGRETEWPESERTDVQLRRPFLISPPVPRALSLLARPRRNHLAQGDEDKTNCQFYLFLPSFLPLLTLA